MWKIPLKSWKAKFVITKMLCSSSLHSCWPLGSLTVYWDYFISVCTLTSCQKVNLLFPCMVFVHFEGFQLWNKICYVARSWQNWKYSNWNLPRLHYGDAETYKVFHLPSFPNKTVPELGRLFTVLLVAPRKPLYLLCIGWWTVFTLWPLNPICSWFFLCQPLNKVLTFAFVNSPFHSAVIM